MPGKPVTNNNSKHIELHHPPLHLQKWSTALLNSIFFLGACSSTQLSWVHKQVGLEEMLFLISRKHGLHAASKAQLFSCLLVNFQRQTSPALQSNTALAEEIKVLKGHNVSLFIANRKAMLHLEDLDSAELNLFSSKEESFKLRLERLMPSLSNSSLPFLSQANPLVEHPFPQEDGKGKD